jgi:hypothetical protein
MNNKKTELSVDPSIALFNNQNIAEKPSEHPFYAQGFLRNNYYFYVKEIDDVVMIKSNQFNQHYLLQLADIDYWRSHYGSVHKRCKSGVDWNAVELSLITKCRNRGQFQGAAVKDKAIQCSSGEVSLAKNIKEA